MLLVKRDTLSRAYIDKMLFPDSLLINKAQSNKLTFPERKPGRKPSLSQREESPWQAAREYEARVKQEVTDRLLKLFLEIRRVWLQLPGEFKKAVGGDEPFKLNGKIFINPKTGKPLTETQWGAVTKNLDKAFLQIFKDHPDRLVKKAMMLGKILQGMDYDSRQSTELQQIKWLKDLPKGKENQHWTNSQTFAQQHSGELISNLESTSRKRITNTILDSMENHNTPRQLEIKLFDDFANINRDWRRIAETEVNNNLTSGLLMSELDDSEEDETVFMIGVSAGNACKYCKNLIEGQVVVLSPKPVSGGTVKVKGVTYPVIWTGKSNVGRGAGNYWSVIPLHPHCRCSWTRYYPEMAALLGVEKARSYPEGTIRIWAGKKYKKVGGKWKLISSKPKIKEESSDKGDYTDLQWKQIHSKEFKSWFGDWEDKNKSSSKVVNTQGQPLIVYKAYVPTDWDTGKEIQIMDRQSEFPSFHQGEPGVKISGFFGKNKKWVEDFGKRLSKSSVTKAFYLNFRSPYIIDAKGKKAGDIQFGASGKPFREAIRSGKYDGVIINNTSDEGDIYVALKPNQIKSAEDNTGEFSSKVDEFRKSKYALMMKARSGSGKKIIIGKSPTADTRTCDFSKVSREELERSTHQHIQDVSKGLNYFRNRLKEAAQNHDCTKLSCMDEFYRDFQNGFKTMDWYESIHLKQERHHIAHPKGSRKDVDLIDVLEFIADGIMARKARGSKYKKEDLPKGLLDRAFSNTIDKLLKLVEVK